MADASLKGEIPRGRKDALPYYLKAIENCPSDYIAQAKAAEFLGCNEQFLEALKAAKTCRDIRPAPSPELDHAIRFLTYITEKGLTK